MLPSLSATVGLRLLSASQHFTREGGFFFAGDPPVDASIDTKAHATTPRLALNWVLEPSVSLYGNVAKGFRLGGANRPIPYSDACAGRPEHAAHRRQAAGHRSRRTASGATKAAPS